MSKKYSVTAYGVNYFRPNKQNVQIVEGDEVNLSIRNLFNKANPIFLGHVVHDDDNYILYNDDNENACFDGETCRVDQIGSCLITFANDNGDITIFFTLTHEEAMVALFPTDDICD